MIYFTADFHFYHENIIKFCKRPYSNAEKMNVDLIKNVNDTVDVNDELYILGDFGFGSTSQIKVILNQISCKNLHYIYGNHDKAMCQPDVMKYFKTMGHYKKISHNGVQIIMCHYPLLEWESCHRGAWALHGHTHGTLVLPESLKDKKIVDVGVDVWHYKPVSFIELENFMKNKQNITFGYKE